MYAYSIWAHRKEFLNQYLPFHLIAKIYSSSYNKKNKAKDKLLHNGF